jgi:S1-C subfamily serine protease
MGSLGAESGVVVYKVQGGVAARIGLQRGDIPLSLNGEKITSVSQLKILLENESAARWQIQLRRAGQTLNMTISG